MLDLKPRHAFAFALVSAIFVLPLSSCLSSEGNVPSGSSGASFTGTAGHGTVVGASGMGTTGASAGTGNASSSGGAPGSAGSFTTGGAGGMSASAGAAGSAPPCTDLQIPDP